MGKQFDQWQGITSVHKVQWWHNVPGQSLLCIQKSTHNVIVDEVSLDLQASEPPVQFKHSKPCDRGQNLQLTMINNLWSSRELIKRLNSSVLSRSFHPTCGCVRDFEHSVYFCNTVVRKNNHEENRMASYWLKDIAVSHPHPSHCEFAERTLLKQDTAAQCKAWRVIKSAWCRFLKCETGAVSGYLCQDKWRSTASCTSILLDIVALMFR